MKTWWLLLSYFLLSGLAFMHRPPEVAGWELFICGPASSLDYSTSAIEALSNPDLAIPGTLAPLYGTIALHVAIWVCPIMIVIFLNSTSWKMWVMISVIWIIGIFVNAIYLAMGTV